MKISIAMVALLTVLVVSRAFAQKTATFSDASLFGSYTVRFATYNFQGLGIFSFDGKGNVSGSEEVESTVCQVSGSYTVNRDGTGSMSLAPTCSFDISGWNFVIADPLGNTAYAFTTEVGPPPEPGVSATFTRRVVLRPNFTVARLSGSYALLISGVGGNDGMIFGLGILNSDGKGNASVTLNFQTSFASCSGTTNGTYTVNPDGTGTLNLPVIWVAPNCVFSEPVSPTLTPWNLFFDDALGSQIDALVADGNEIVVGKLSRQ